MADAAYFRAWRAKHPEYRARQNRLRNERRARVGRGDRRREYARRPSRALPSIPTLHQGHDLFDAARAIVGRNTSGLKELLDPLYDDLVSVAVLALVEGSNAVEAVRAHRADEATWRRLTVGLPDWR